MLLKIYILHTHLNLFPDNLKEVNDEHSESFHQDISDIKTRYEGKLNDRMMGDYC